MKHLVIIAHPYDKSFNKAIFDSVVEESINSNCEIKTSNLYELGFNPVLSTADIVDWKETKTTTLDVKTEQEKLIWADLVTIVHPVWWGTFPAMLTGYFDRVFLNGFLYKHTKEGSVSLLNIKKLLVFCTTGNKKETYDNNGMHESIKTIYEHGINKSLLSKNMRITFFNSVPSTTDEIRKGYLKEARNIIKEEIKNIKITEESKMFDALISKLKKEPKKIVFPEGTDKRILSAAVRLKNEKIVNPILIGDEIEIKNLANELKLDLNEIEIINPKKYDKFLEMTSLMFELRKGKMTEEECQKACLQTNYFGTMLVKMNYAYGLLGGATYSTADTVRPALQLIKTKPGSNIVSSSFILRRTVDKKEEIYIMGDCAINLSPTEDDLVDIAIDSAHTAKVFGLNPVVALLSYSTLGSGKGETVDIVKNASIKLKERNLDFLVDGELQFDAAFSKEVAAIKAPNSKVAGKANTFIFPNINAGNIGYKIAQRLGGFEAIGPILQGLNAPINDLSRGCNEEEVYKLAIITASL